MSMLHPANAVLDDRASVRLGELEQMSPGPVLLSALLELGKTAVGAYGSVRLSALWAKMTAHCQAQQMIATYEAAAGADRHLLASGHGAVELAGEELAAIVHSGSGAAIAHVELTQYVGDLLALGWAALVRGDLSLDHLKRLMRSTEHAPGWVASAIDAQLIPLAISRGWTPAKLAAEATKAILVLDPDGAADRAKRAKADADVCLTAGPDETAMLFAQGDAVTLQQVMEAIHQRAAQLTQASIERLPAGVTRFRALADLVLGSMQAAKPNVEALLTIDLTTWLGLTRTPGELSGYGVITAETARLLSEDAEFRLMITDPVTGEAMSLGRTRYRPSAALRRFIHSRDRCCQFPGCCQPATRCDIDHIIEDRLGGPTSPDNLHSLCRRHHNLKTHQLWHVQRLSSREASWTSALGFTFTTSRESYRLQPVEPPDNGPADEREPDIPAANPYPTGWDEPLPEPPDITLEEYLQYQDDLERRLYRAANRSYDTFYVNNAGLDNDGLDIAS